MGEGLSRWAESAERAAKVAIEKEGSGLSRDGALTRSRYD